MLNRRFHREKILQNLYAFYQGGIEDARVAEKNIEFGAHKLYELYIRLASVLVELSDFAQFRIDEARQKHIPTEAEKNPNMRFVQNRFIEQLRTNPTFILKSNEYKISWKQEDELFRSLYQLMLKSASYEAYMNDAESSYEKDKAFVCSFLKRKISNNSNVYHYFEDQSMFWANDFDNVAFWLLKSLKKVDEQSQIILSEDTFIGVEDLKFAKQLFESTVLHSDEYIPIIKTYLANWEIDRTPMLDVLIIKMAITELFYFPSIPVKVTLNEYVEIIKEFSAESSRVFVNGLLNKLSENFIKSGQIKKSGRGLI
ncbi:MAG: transcription antitermination protein NusB [Bacteroidales bacterium]|jgi:N utilization substance protein B|nr:transcription antitermination protein NusB [Bacteroidales bacterium]